MKLETLEKRAQLAAEFASLPGAPWTILVDLDGAENVRFDSGRVFDIPAYGGTEADVDRIMALVSEDWAPFNVNVTNSPALASGRTLRVCVGGYSQYYGVGGVAVLGTMLESHYPDVAFVFSAAQGEDPRAVGDRISHEAGHAFGLLHQSLWVSGTLVNDYRSAVAPYALAPIMGGMDSRDRATWSAGLNDNGVWQDDVAKLGSVLGFRPDEPTTTIVSGFSGLLNGPIDRDVFKVFCRGVTRVSLSLPRDHNAVAAIELRSASNVRIGFDSSVLVRNLPAGWYTITVGGWASDVGNMGRYAVSIESEETAAVLLGEKR